MEAAKLFSKKKRTMQQKKLLAISLSNIKEDEVLEQASSIQTPKQSNWDKNLENFSVHPIDMFYARPSSVERQAANSQEE